MTHSKSWREGFNQHPSTTNASLTATIQKTAQDGNFGPDHFRKIHPFLFAMFDALPSPKNQLLYYVHERYVPRQQHVAANQLRGSTTSMEDSGSSQQYFPASSTWHIDPVHHRFAVTSPDFQRQLVSHHSWAPGVQRAPKLLVSFSGCLLPSDSFFSVGCLIILSRLIITSSLRGGLCIMKLNQSNPSLLPPTSTSGYPTALLCCGIQICASFHLVTFAGSFVVLMT